MYELSLGGNKKNLKFQSFHNDLVNKIATAISL